MMPLTTSPPGFIADHRNDAMCDPYPTSRRASRLAADTAHELLERGITLDHSKQPGLEDRPHARVDGDATLTLTTFGTSQSGSEVGNEPSRASDRSDGRSVGKSLSQAMPAQSVAQWTKSCSCPIAFS